MDGSPRSGPRSGFRDERPGARDGAPRYLTHFRSDIFWWEPDGKVVRISPGDGVYLMACVHPTGDHAVFWGGSTGRPRLWIADGTGRAEPVTGTAASARYPAYNLGGDLLVYCRSTDATERIERIARGNTAARPRPSVRMQIVLRRTSDGVERELTDGRFLDQRPALSPDGSQVAFVSDRGRQQGLWRVPTAGGEPVPLVTGRRGYRPWWSVDGSRIYFFLLGPDRDRVHWVPASGGSPVPLANDDRGDTHGPYADPNGSDLLVHSTRAGENRPGQGLWGLFELPLDGAPARRLSPPGHSRGAHPTRARNGVLTFDVSRAAPR